MPSKVLWVRVGDRRQETGDRRQETGEMGMSDEVGAGVLSIWDFSAQILPKY
ncbi:MAG: hypothetical protein F6K48_27340 [Okeania sp. SIO3H1]|nr:hypothetical protein [Okeania sp. SIO3H1]